MRCPQCGHFMAPLSVGMLCANCGFADESRKRAVPEVLSKSILQRPKMRSLPPRLPKRAVNRANRPLPTVRRAAANTAGVPRRSKGFPRPHLPKIQLPKIPIPSLRFPSIKFKKKYTLIAVAAGLTLAALTGASAFAYMSYDANRAPAVYFANLINSKTGNVVVSASVANSGSGVTLVSQGMGPYDLTNASAMSTDLKFSVNSAGSVSSGELMSVANTTYINVAQLDFLHKYFPYLQSGWYRFTPPSTTSCTLPAGAAANLFGFPLPADLAFLNTKRVGWHETVKEATATHYTGAVDVAKLRDSINNINHNLPVGCKVSVSGDTLKGVAINYELWHEKGFDRFTFQLIDSRTKGTINVALDTSKYGQPVTIVPPANAKLYSNIPPPPPPPPPAVKPAPAPKRVTPIIRRRLRAPIRPTRAP